MKGQRTRARGGAARQVQISPLTVKRLSLYLRYLQAVQEEGRSTVSSRQLGQALGLTDAQVRKDLAYFGQFGRPGVGYDVADLVNRLQKIFGTDRTSNVAVVGVGSLGRALIGYKGFLKKGFRLVAAFDIDPRKVGQKFGEVTVRPMRDLPKVVKRQRIRLAIVAVPADAAQEVADTLTAAGVRGVLNFAPVTLNGSTGLAVVPVDLAQQLEQLSYLVGTAETPRKPRSRSSGAARQS